MTLKPVPTFGRSKVTSSIVTRVQHFVPKEESFPTPLEYIDVTKSTQADLHVMQAKHIDDDWNVDSNKH